MSDIRPGDFVECIDDVPYRAESKVMPVLGGLYTIANMRTVDGAGSVRLKELTPICHLGGLCGCGECGWDVNRFRKVYRPGPWLVEELERPVLEDA